LPPKKVFSTKTLQPGYGPVSINKTSNST